MKGGLGTRTTGRGGGGSKGGGMYELSTGGDESAAQAMSGKGEVLTERPREEGKKRSGGDVEVGDSRQTREVLSKNVQQTSEDAQRTEAEVSGGKGGWPEGKRGQEGIAHAGGESVSRRGETAVGDLEKGVSSSLAKGLTHITGDRGREMWESHVPASRGRSLTRGSGAGERRLSADQRMAMEAMAMSGFHALAPRSDGGGKVPMKEEEKRKRGAGAQVEEDGRGSSASDEGGGGDGESLGGQPPGGGKVEVKGERGAQYCEIKNKSREVKVKGERGEKYCEGERGPGYNCDEEKKYRGQKERKQSQIPGSRQTLGGAGGKGKQSSHENIEDDSEGGIVEEEGGRSVVHNTEGDGLATGSVSSNHGIFQK
ncbi:unnamed protein product [Ectocarpus sp. CCAP 1310/34]|nr:unnamed protein product [Ectocarpus sp. CCAP 1310/34]